MILSNSDLKELYLGSKKSVSEISKTLGCSENKINYWLKKYNIPKRSISEAIYLKNNPNGDPFKIKKSLNRYDDKILGLGLGLFWGEGHRKNKKFHKIGKYRPKTY